MSISNISHASPIGLGTVLGKTQNTSATKPSDFAAFYQNASGIEHVKGVSAHTVGQTGAASSSDVDRANSALFGNNGAHFAQLLAKAANHTISSSQAIQDTTFPKNDDLALINGSSSAMLQEVESAPGADNIAAQAAQIVGALDLAKIREAQQALIVAPYDPQAPVNLADKTLDFSTMLPQGMRSFLQELKCAEGELNGFVNEMIFGSANGPHGQNAAAYFGKDTLTGAQLSEHMNGLLDAAKINTADFAAQDFNFVLRPQSNQLGNTVALSNGADLQERSLEREVNKTFQSDMALMQVLAHTNNQSATIF